MVALWASRCSVFRKRFCRDVEIDSQNRQKLISEIQEAQQDTEVSDEVIDAEREEITRCRHRFKQFSKTRWRRVPIETDSEFVSAVGQQLDADDAEEGTGGGEVWCKLSTTVRCDPEEALAFLLDVTSRALLTERDVEEVSLAQRAIKRSRASASGTKKNAMGSPL